MKLLVPFVLTLSTVIACGHAGEEDAASATGAVIGGATPTATLSTKSIDEVVGGTCNVMVKEIEVGGIEAAAAARINQELQRNRMEHTAADAECSEYNATMTVAYNGNGYLSIGESQGSFVNGAKRYNHSIRGHNFDLATGALLSLGDVVGEVDLTTAIATCAAHMREVEVALDGTEKDVCARALREENGPTTFTFDASGIRIHPISSNLIVPFDADGALIPWSNFGKLTAVGAAVRDTTK